MRDELEKHFNHYSINIDNIYYAITLTEILNKYLINQIEWRTTFKCLSCSDKSLLDFLKKTASFLLLENPPLSKEIMKLIMKEFPEIIKKEVSSLEETGKLISEKLKKYE